MTVTTKADFELFCKESERWIDIFGLKDWEVKFSHLKNSNGKDYSYFNSNCENRTVMLELCDKWPKRYSPEKTNNEIKLCAFHEVCHIFLETLASCARTRHILPHEIDEAGHGIIRTLERVLYPKYEK